MKQTVSNACGTVAILHSLLNAKEYLPSFPKDSYLAKFLANTKHMSPDERAAFLEADDEIEVVHEGAAAEGQSNQIDADDVNSHFVCFSVVDGCLYELDGRKRFPVNHGGSSVDTLLVDSCKVVKQFMDRDPAELRFTMIALAPPMPADED
jgi:ubiquitin carboxyl-terminal hydrolase L3